MQLWLMRHAQPLLPSGVCYGALDIAADRAASQTAAAELASALPMGVHVHYSPLQRCEQLVPLLKGLRPDLAYKCEPDLREMHFGQWEGQRWDAISPDELKAWTDDFENYACGATGESAGQFVRRVHGAVLRCAVVYGDKVGDAVGDGLSATPRYPPTVWITHAGVIRAIAWLRQRSLTGLAPQTLGLSAADWPQDAPGFGQIQQVDWPGRAPPTRYPAPPPALAKPQVRSA
jgi:alpha-ribazole phosphatase